RSTRDWSSDVCSSDLRNAARIVFKLITVFPRSGPGENQAADFFRIVERDPLGDPSPHGMAHDMGASNAESIHQSDAVFGKELGRSEERRVGRSGGLEV